MLLDDAIELAERAKAAGVDATLEVWDHMIHVWHWFLPMLDEAQAAVEAIGRLRHIAHDRVGRPATLRHSHSSSAGAHG